MPPESGAGPLGGRKVFDLGVELYHGMPHHPMHSPFMYQMLRTHGDLMYGEGVSAAVDVVVRGDVPPEIRRSVELCQKYGHELAVGVEEALQQPLKPISGGLRSAFELIELPYLKTVTRDDLHPLLQDASPIRARWAAVRSS